MNEVLEDNTITQIHQQPSKGLKKFLENLGMKVTKAAEEKGGDKEKKPEVRWLAFLNGRESYDFAIILDPILLLYV